ncbi:MAG: hypothetical protein M1819_006844 [Sarea resinae]|nr:MAG: hypothetical protein M1819_006844 [Sarea resinae]
MEEESVLQQKPVEALEDASGEGGIVSHHESDEASRADPESTTTPTVHLDAPSPEPTALNVPQEAHTLSSNASSVSLQPQTCHVEDIEDGGEVHEQGGPGPDLVGIGLGHAEPTAHGEAEPIEIGEAQDLPVQSSSNIEGEGQAESFIHNKTDSESANTIGAQPLPADSLGVSGELPVQEDLVSKQAEVQPTGEAAEPIGAKDVQSFPEIVEEESHDIGHSSRISFARTVSHDVSWAEDDETDPAWNVSRRDTDPFKALASVGRTNSFPEVPPAHNPQESASHTLPSSQAENVIQGIDGWEDSNDLGFGDEGDSFFDEKLKTDPADASFFDSGPTDANPGLFDESNGGPVSTPPQAESRFEEGLPLISSSSKPQGEPSAPFDNQTTRPEHYASNQKAGDEDFFEQARKASEEKESSFRPDTLDRKSTAQVLGSLQFAPHHETHDEAPPSKTPQSRASTADLSGGGLAVSTSTVISQVLNEQKPHEDAPHIATETDDGLAAAWKAALDDDEFLDEGDDQVDPASFFQDDGEGFLDENQDFQPQAEIQSPPELLSTAGPNGQSFRRVDAAAGADTAPKTMYTPSNVASQAQSPDPFTLSRSQTFAPGTHASGTPNMGNPPPLQSTNTFGQPLQNAAWPSSSQQQRPSLPSKAQSFADKSKGGYQSPYDLPMPISRPRKKASMQHLPMAQVHQPLQPPQPPPPRSTSLYSHHTPQAQAGPPPLPHPPPTATSSSSLSPPPSSHSMTSPVSGLGPGTSDGNRPALRAKASSSSFFEELPVTAKPRHHHSGRYTPQMSAPTPPPSQGLQPHDSLGPPPIQRQISSSYLPPPESQLRPPERMSPYAAPPQSSSTNLSANVPSGPRYSPVPPRSSGGPSPNKYAMPPTSTPPQSHALPFQPRTSSPLAHHGRPFQQEPSLYQGIRKSSHDSHVSSPLNELIEGIKEEDGLRRPSLENETPFIQDGGQAVNVPPTNRYTSESMNIVSPPRKASPVYATSPPKRPSSNLQYQPITPVIEQSIAPLRRSQTQSPGTALSGVKLSISPQDPYQRPATSHDPKASISSAGTAGPYSHRRNFSRNYNYITPSDGRETDPLQRWKGCPIFNWGFGGIVVTSFPKDVPRYSTGHTIPQVLRSPGEIQVQKVKDMSPLDQSFTKFPGPMKGKGKKKEVMAWLDDRIREFEQEIATVEFAKRHQDKILLWKIIRILVEHDGVLEGNPLVTDAVRAVVSPDVGEYETQPPNAIGSDSAALSAAQAQSDPLNHSSVESLRRDLLKGDREKAIWNAVDKRLWAHALLISSSVSKDIWKQVVQEFVRQEVRSLGENSQPLAALYEIFAGNWEESIDELVPPSARAGFQMISKAAGSGSTKNALDGLDRWRDTLALVISNRSTDDGQGLMALGGLLANYGRIEAAHVCFLFSKPYSSFGGADGPQSNIVLLGADHVKQPFDFGRDLDSLLLTEIYEYALSLGASSSSAAAPHLQAYKLHHAFVLAECGYRTEAQQYCDGIAGVLKSTTKPSSYYHNHLFASLDDLSKRLSQSPKDGTSSWISKPSIEKVSGSVWAKFNSFVAGEDSDGPNGAGKGGDDDAAGPFARIAGDTPTISRSASNVDLYSSQPAAPMGNPRYAPSGQYAHRPSLDQQMKPPFEVQSPSSYGPSSSFMGAPLDAPVHTTQRAASDYGGYGSATSPAGSYEPPSQLSQYPTMSPPSLSMPPTSQPRSIPARQDSYMPTAPLEMAETPPYQPSPRQATPLAENPYFSGYTPPKASAEAQPLQPTSSTYGAPSYGGYEPPAAETTYEPPSYDPNGANGDASPVEERPKKKSIMDDDDDDFAAKAAEVLKKDKAQKDREADEAFRKAAEADAKRDTAAQQEKKSWFGSWFGRKSSDPGQQQQHQGPIKAKLGEENSFYYDPDLKKWVNKKAGAEGQAHAHSPTPPPPRASGPPSRSASGPPLSSRPPGLLTTQSSPMMGKGLGVGIGTPGVGGVPPLPQAQSSADSLSAPSPSLTGGPPGAAASANASASGSLAPPTPAASGTPGLASGPPSRPPTSMSNASSIDDLLGAPAARKGGTVRKNKRRGNYVDVMAK